MNTLKRKSTQERKSEIVDAAFSLSLDVGPGRITTEALAKKIGLSHAAIFRHFPTKEDIWSAVFETISQKMEQGWSDLELAPSSCKRLHDLVGAQLRLVTAVPALPSIIFSRELHIKNAGIRNGVLALMKRFHAILSTEIQAGITRGELRPDIDSDEAANLVIAALQGTVLRWSIASKRFDLIAEGGKMLALVIRGLQSHAQKS